MEEVQKMFTEDKTTAARSEASILRVPMHLDPFQVMVRNIPSCPGTLFKDGERDVAEATTVKSCWGRSWRETSMRPLPGTLFDPFWIVLGSWNRELLLLAH